MNSQIKKKIAVFTTTRAEFGLLSGLLRAIDQTDDLAYLLFAGGAHLAPEAGATIDEIRSSGITVIAEFDYLLNGDSSASLGKSLGIATCELAQIFETYEFDAVCVLGDRFELLAVVAMAVVFRKPIIHIHGGERTEGALDEQVRHMITKAAHIHFPACEEYAANIRNMGESAWRIFNTGSLAADNIRYLKKIGKKSLFKELQLSEDKPVVLLTWHPETMDEGTDSGSPLETILEVLKTYDLQVVMTAPGVEHNRENIEKTITKWVQRGPDYHYIKSLGMQRYYSLLPECRFVIGNSSSGLIDAPYFRIPTINIGSRQDGRIRHASVIDAAADKPSLKKAIDRAVSETFRQSIGEMPYKFGDGTTAEKMIAALRSLKFDAALLNKKLDFPEQRS